eukprot:92872_1
MMNNHDTGEKHDNGDDGVNMNNKVNTSVNASPPSANKSRSNSTSVQHDQIPINSSSITHSSASYKQELMDSSVLLDNINEALSMWDNSRLDSQTLPSFINSTNLNNNNNNNNATTTTRRHSHHKRQYKSQEEIGVNSYGPHQTYYIKDDTLISKQKQKQKQKHFKKHSKKYNKSSSRHHSHHS